MPNKSAQTKNVASKPKTKTNLLANTKPVPDTLLGGAGNEAFKKMFDNLQGNILKGHGRDFSANIFVEFTCSNKQIAKWLSTESDSITTAALQLKESEQFKRLGIPGALFQNIYLTSALYRKLGIRNIETAFADKSNPAIPVLPQQANFLGGMKKAAVDLLDDTEEMEQRKAENKTDALEDAYLDQRIHAMILLADDSETYLLRNCRSFISTFEGKQKTSPAMGKVLAVELGKALRNDDDEGIEHFGYVDGRSQPLFLASDFKGLTKSGDIDLVTTKEKINEKAKKKETGDLNVWNPFASLDLVLIEDKLANEEHAYGSYFVFRKLEQDVMRFSMEEQLLADKLKLVGEDRERAGAMAVGRFRDGTPLVLSQSDGLIPAKANNFRYDGLDANLTKGNEFDDSDGLRCPFHAHIRKTNPRQSTEPFTVGPDIPSQEKEDKGHRIVRRGIPYGVRVKAPNAFQALDDLPSSGVGLLFGCFQSSIVRGFAFMQKTWVNNIDFKRPGAGVDPLIGQRSDPGNTEKTDQHWRKTFGEDIDNREPNEGFPETHPVKYPFSDFIKFKGGEFFFAPSLPFFRKLPKLVGGI